MSISCRFILCTTLISLVLQGCSQVGSFAENQKTSVTQYVWQVDRLDSVGGHSVELMGDPEVVESAQGASIEFDGDGDRLLVDANPVFGAEEFTIEIVFNPNDVYPNNTEPRFFHIEDANNNKRRITIELRLNDKKQWYFDAYIKSEMSAFTLVDDTLVHPVEGWFHAAITYKDREFVSYVNGKKELSAEVDYLPIAQTAKTSIGSRLNQVHWFNGKVSQVAITHKVLEPADFLLIDEL